MSLSVYCPIMRLKDWKYLKKKQKLESLCTISINIAMYQNLLCFSFFFMDSAIFKNILNFRFSVAFSTYLAIRNVPNSL